MTLIQLDKLTAATHVRIVVTSVYTNGGTAHVSAENISFIGCGVNPYSHQLADYTSVETALAKVPEDLTIYTDETASVVTEAVEAVVNNLDITKQVYVDAMATAIEEAVAALVIKPKAFDLAILARNAKANSEQLPAGYINDGGASWAFDGIAGHWWHTRYQDWGQKATHEVSNGKPSAENPIWIQTGFEREWYVESIKYMGRSDNHRGWIKDYEIWAANLSNATAEPTDSDFVFVKSGSLGTETTEQTILLEKAIVATHVRIVVKSVYNNGGDGTLAAEKISIFGYDDNPTSEETADYTMVDEAIAKIPSDLWSYTDETANAVTTARDAVVRNLNITKQPYVNAMATAIEDAVAALQLEFVYSVEDPFMFPTEENESVTLEMEYLERHNNTDNDGGWPVQITKKDWASNGKILNALNNNDRAILYYNASKAGIYSAVVTYRSGSEQNSLEWSESDGNIVAGNVFAGSNDNVEATHTATFTFEVTKAGPGVLTFTGGDGNAPQLDKVEIQLSVQAPEFRSASLTLYDNIAINFKVDATLFPESDYENLKAEFVVNGDTEHPIVVDEYKVDGDRYVFEFTDVAPQCLNDTISATLYAEVDGVSVKSEVLNYSGAQYCYNMLRKSSDEALKTLCVDLLNYASEAQSYLDENLTSSDLANGQLTDEEKTWATSEAQTAYNNTDFTFGGALDGATVEWTGVGLRLDDSVSIRYKIKSTSLEGLSLKVAVGTVDSAKIWTIDSKDFVAVEGEEGNYYVYLDKLNAAQMRTVLYATVVDSTGKAVSNTSCYSIDSYVATEGTDLSSKLGKLLDAMIKYGDAAAAFVKK